MQTSRHAAIFRHAATWSVTEQHCFLSISVLSRIQPPVDTHGLLCSLLSYIIHLRSTLPVLPRRCFLQRMESAALATEVASKAMEQSAKEFEQTSLLFQADTPAMIAEIEAAAAEYRELGHTLNIMTAGFRGKNPVKDWSQLSMKRVAKDVSALTNVSHHGVSHACWHLDSSMSLPATLPC